MEETLFHRINVLQKTFDVSTKDRREALVHEMEKLERQGVDCRQCRGVCCTFVANSMQTTVLETIDLLFYLRQENRLNPDLIKQLHQTVTHYRLDRIPGDGQRDYIRRTYTCPFFQGGPVGCSISRWAKPYGCLGFNPHSPRQTEGGDCTSHTVLLEQREALYFEEERCQNRKLQQQLGLFWTKLPMPLALLEVLQKLELPETKIEA